MMITGRGHLLRALGFRRKTLGAAAYMEGVCGAAGEIRDGEMRFFYPELISTDRDLLLTQIQCPTCKYAIESSSPPSLPP